MLAMWAHEDMGTADIFSLEPPQRVFYPSCAAALAKQHTPVRPEDTDVVGVASHGGELPLHCNLSNGGLHDAGLFEEYLSLRQGRLNAVSLGLGSAPIL